MCFLHFVREIPNRDLSVSFGVYPGLLSFAELSISHGPKFPAVINLISDLHSRNNLENFFTGRISFGREEEL